MLFYKQYYNYTIFREVREKLIFLQFFYNSLILQTIFQTKHSQHSNVLVHIKHTTGTQVHEKQTNTQPQGLSAEHNITR